MAKVLNSCKEPVSNLRSRSESEPSLADIYQQLGSLPPSKEILNFYKAKLDEYCEEDEQVRKRLANILLILDTGDRLRQELEMRDQTIDQLQAKLLESKQSYLDERRRRTEAESGKGGSVRGARASGGGGVSARSGGASVRSSSGREGSARSSAREPVSSVRNKPNQACEVEYLREQINLQEQCHQNDMREEKELRHAQQREHRLREACLQQRIAQQEDTIQSVRQEIKQLTESFLQERTKYRSNEKNWMLEKEKLTKKVSFLTKFGGSGSSLSDGGGGNTRQRLQSRLSVEKQLRSEVARLKTGLQESTAVLENLRSDFCQLDKENSILKEQLQSKSKVLESTKGKGDEETRMLKERLEGVEKRRRLEAQGHQADIKRLRKEIRELESRILQIVSSKSTEKENHRILEDIRESLQNVENSQKASGKREWVS